MGDRLGQAIAWSPPEVPGSTTSLFLSAQARRLPSEERIEAAAGQAEVLGGLSCRPREQPEGSQHMAYERRCVAIG